MTHYLGFNRRGQVVAGPFKPFASNGHAACFVFEHVDGNVIIRDDKCIDLKIVVRAEDFAGIAEYIAVPAAPVPAVDMLTITHKSDGGVILASRGTILDYTAAERDALVSDWVAGELDLIAA